MIELESPAWAGHAPTPDYVASLDFFELFRPGGPYSSPGDTPRRYGQKVEIAMSKLTVIEQLDQGSGSDEEMGLKAFPPPADREWYADGVVQPDGGPPRQLYHRS